MQNQSRVIKFLFGGGTAAAFNLFVMWLLVEHLGFQTPTLINLANIISIELSIIFCFFVYRTFVWPERQASLKRVLLVQLPLYHVSTSLSVVLRILVLFPLLNWLGVSYSANTLIGIALGAGMNYVISDKIIFNAKTSGKPPTNASAAVTSSAEPALSTSAYDHQVGADSRDEQTSESVI